MKRQNKIFSKL